MLREDQLRRSNLVGVLVGPVRIAAVVVVLAVEHHHNVGILFDRARFTEIAHARTMAFALFRRTIELRKTKHGQIQFTCHRLDATRDFAHFELTTFNARTRTHELQVVDRDEADTKSLFQTTRFRAHCKQRQTWRVIDEERKS